MDGQPHPGDREIAKLAGRRHGVVAFWQLIVELDSWKFHRHRTAFEDDRERDAVLLLAGFRVIRVTWRQLAREPGKLANRLRDLL